MNDLYVGLMSGTSLDGIDAALVEFEGDRPILRATHYEPYEPALRVALLALCYVDQVSLRALGEMDARLGGLLATAVQRLLEKARVEPPRVSAIGSHGQTVFHHPHGEFPFTWQIGDPNRIAEITGIRTVADVRRRDVAAGGQGAPLVPALHRALFHDPSEDRVVLNIGGIANVTILPRDGAIIGFDTGPGNTLMDAWIRRHRDLPHDAGGAWAATAEPDRELVSRLLDDPYFSRPAPKSTGQERFSQEWLAAKLDGSLDPAVVQASLCELTAISIAMAVRGALGRVDRVLVCGGGVHNRQLIGRLASHLGCPVEPTDQHGLAADWVEAVAFAWIARQTVLGRPGNLPTVTGAAKPVRLGALYPE